MRTRQLTVQPTCVGHQSQKGFHLQLILNLCTDGYRGQVWLYVMIVSVLCRSTCAYNGAELEDVQRCIQNVKPKIEKQNSNAMLYTPPPENITEKCKTVSLMCYMLELTMVISEEQVQDNDTDCIFGFKSQLNDKTHAGTCPPCEDTKTLRNLTVFMDNLVSVLKLLNTNANPL